MTCLICGAAVGNAAICPRCGANLAAPPISPALPAGTRLFGGKYTVGRVLGEGGFGITYKGADTVLNRPVAIKELFPQGCQRNGTIVQPAPISPSDFADMRQRFLDEARLLASFSHPGIVRVYEVFEENNTAYMVMEFLNGRSLAKLVKERGGALGEQEAVEYILKVCEALDVVHQRGYLHRDIKPENIILCEDGRVILIDFGAARAYMAGKTMTVILTPGYAPLEQYAEQARWGVYTDIYALGATLYYLLTGVVPVSATDRAAGVELKGVREINGRVSKQVDEAVKKAMAMQVDDRPQSVEEFLGLLMGSLVSVGAPPQVSVRKRAWQEVATLKGHADWVESVAFSPDGRFLASGSYKTVKVWAVDSWQEVATLKGHADWVESVAFSPDGRFLASGSYKTVKVWAIGSWQEVATLKGYAKRVESVAFSPDGRFLASGSDDRTVKVWAVGSWQEVATLKGYAKRVESVAFSPDGRFLASGSYDRTVKVWAVGSWQEVATLKGYAHWMTSVAFSPDGRFLASGSYETVKVWAVGSWQEVATLKGYAHWMTSVAFSPDGRFLASGSYETVKVWAVGSWQEVATLKGHAKRLESVAFSPDGRFLASGSDDRTVKVWAVG